MRRVEVVPGRYVKVADDATDDEVAALVAQATPPVRTKVVAPEVTPTKAPPSPPKRVKKATAKKAAAKRAGRRR